MAELVSILEAMTEKEYSDKKFAAAMQGVDLDKETGRQPKQPKQTQQKKSSTFEDIQARVFSGGMAQDANDIMALQGSLGAKQGFQIGRDMDYGKFHQNDPNAPKSPLDF